jgi:hypothetical protein
MRGSRAARRAHTSANCVRRVPDRTGRAQRPLTTPYAQPLRDKQDGREAHQAERPRGRVEPARDVAERDVGEQEHPDDQPRCGAPLADRSTGQTVVARRVACRVVIRTPFLIYGCVGISMGRAVVPGAAAHARTARV